MRFGEFLMSGHYRTEYLLLSFSLELHVRPVFKKIKFFKKQPDLSQHNLCHFLPGAVNDAKKVQQLNPGLSLAFMRTGCVLWMGPGGSYTGKESLNLLRK